MGTKETVVITMGSCGFMTKDTQGDPENKQKISFAAKLVRQVTLFLFSVVVDFLGFFHVQVQF